MKKCEHCGAEFQPRAWSENVETWGRFCSVPCRVDAVTTKHGHSRDTGRSGTYNTWHSMKQRCQNPKTPNFPGYGGRGISVCEKWQTFAGFLDDMGERPEGLTLDRIDNDGNYEPSNCRWATWSQQCRNMRVTPFLTYKGERMSACDLAERLSITKECLMHRVKVGWPEDQWAKRPLR